MQLPLRIALCGGLRVERQGSAIQGALAGRQGREIFAYLALNRGRPVSRDELAVLLWPDRAPRAPEAALNTILARLRRVVGHSVLGARGQLALALPPGSWVDLEAAEEAAGRAESLLGEGRPSEALGQAATGLEIVAAPLLPEVRHAWIDQRRAEVDELRSRMYMATARAGLQLGGSNLDDATRAAQCLIEREPFRESGYALLMEVLAARDDVAEALLVYERLRALLRDELGVTPSARVAALHDKLLRAESTAALTPSTRPASAEAAERLVPLPDALARNSRRRPVGRELELDLLRQRWSELTRHNRSVIAISGEPGIGKTMLAAALARAVHRDGAIVLYGQAQEDAIIPYAPLVEALRHYIMHAYDPRRKDTLSIHLGELAWLIPELARRRTERSPTPGDPRLERARLYQAVAALLAHTASERPVLLVLEDMHCADAETILMVRHLLREVTQQPVLALVTYQDSEVTADHPLCRMLSNVRRDVGVTRLPLRGLPEQAIFELLANGARPTGEFVRSLREHTSGNPFFIEEIVQTLRESGSGLDRGAFCVGELIDLPDGVREVIQNRLRRLEEPTRAALVAAAVLGHEFSLELLQSMIGEQSLGYALEQAVRAGLIVPDSRSSERYRFRHTLARQAIYRSVARSTRADLHLQAARALEERRRIAYVEPAQLAQHLVQSDRSSVADKAIGYLREAASRALATHAYEDAAGHYRRALEVLERHRPRDPVTRCGLLLKLGAVCWQASGPSARVVFEEAVAVARGLEDHSQFAEATLGLGGRFYAPTGPDEPYIHLLEEALQWIRDDGALRTRVLGRLAEHIIFVDPARAARLSEDAVRTARALNDPVLLATTLLSRHAALLHVEHVDERRRTASEAIDHARRTEEREVEALAHHWLLYDLLELGDLQGAVGAQARLAELAREIDQPLYRHSALAWQRVIELMMGRFERAAQLAHEAVNLALSKHGEDANTHFIAQQLAVVPYLGGEAWLRPAAESRATGSDPTGSDPLWSAAVCLLRSDSAEPTTANGNCGALAADRLAALPRTIFWLTTLSWVVEVCVREQDHDRAAVLYELLAPYADRFVQLTFCGSFGCLSRHLGLLAGELGASRQASEHFEEAVRRHAMLGATALEAWARCDYAEALASGRAAGSDRDARAIVERGLAAAESCGATRLSARLRRLTAVGALQTN